MPGTDSSAVPPIFLFYPKQAPLHITCVNVLHSLFSHRKLQWEFQATSELKEASSQWLPLSDRKCSSNGRPFFAVNYNSSSSLPTPSQPFPYLFLTLLYSLGKHGLKCFLNNSIRLHLLYILVIFMSLVKTLLVM